MDNSLIDTNDAATAQYMDNVATDLADITLCKRVATVLLKYYPGHLWHIEANHELAGCVNIKLAYPDRLGILPKFGYRMHIAKLSDKKIMIAGGELLERYRLARGRATAYAKADAIANGLDRRQEKHGRQ